MAETFVKISHPPRIGLFSGKDTIGWNIPQNRNPAAYRSLLARHYSHRQIGQRETRPDIIEVVNIRVEVFAVSAGNWPHHNHEFAFVQSSFACVSPLWKDNEGWETGAAVNPFNTAELRHQNFIEHAMDGVLVKQSEYGHSSMDLYAGAECYLNLDGKNDTRIDCQGYPAADMLWADTFCCGAKLIADQHFTDYSTLTTAHCEECCRKWEVVDGLHFRSRNK